MLKTNRYILGLFIISCVLVGCDGGGGGTNSSSTPPSPPAPPEPTPPVPEVHIPEASNILIATLYNSEALSGSYKYSDPDNRPEGKSNIVWKDEQGNDLGTSETFPISQKTDGQSVKYCVTPVTYSGASGKMACSSLKKINISPTEVDYSTDWNSDNDAAGDVNPWYHNERDTPSGNVHFYYNINITPISPDEYGLGTLSATDETPLQRNYYDYFDLDNVYAYYSDNKGLILTNNTIRYIQDPIIKVGTDSYFKVTGYLLKPFTTVKLTGLTEDHRSESDVAYVETNPGYKGQVDSYDHGSTANLADKSIIPDVFDYKKQHNFQRKNLGTDSNPVSEEQAEAYNQLMRSLKISYNRFDFSKYFFDSFNNFRTLDGTATGMPFSNMTTYYDEPLEGTCITNGYSACGVNNVKAKTAYQLNGYKRFLSHASSTKYGVFVTTDNMGGYSTSEAYGVSYVALGDVFVSTATGIDVLNHELAHSLGYNEDSGMAYGWSDAIYSFAMKTDYFPVNKDKTIDTGRSVIESSDYFADYKWIDATTVDVHFFAKNSNTLPIKNISVLADDEESIMSYPNFCGDWGASGGSADCDLYGIDGVTYSAQDPDGALLLDKGLEILSNNTVRIKLKAPIKNNSKTLFLFASGADSNDASGVWKTDYNQKTSDSFAIQIPYDKQINVAEDHIVYASGLDNNDKIMRYGSTGHVGENGKYETGHPDYLLPSSLYKTYNLEGADQRCKELGYAGLGKLPFEATSEASDPLALKIVSYVLDGTIVGYSYTNPSQIEMVQMYSQGGNGYHNGSAYSRVLDPNTSNASLLVCKTFN